MSAHSYFQHDDRGDSRHVKMGKKKNRKKYQGKYGGFKGPRSGYDDDGDIDMGSLDRPSNSRFKPYKGRSRFGKHGVNHYGGGGGGRGPLRNSFGNDDKDSHWFKITIPFGKKLGKTFIMKAISSHCRTPFIPYNFHFHDAAAMFYVNNPQTSLALQQVSRRVTTPDGFKMAIYSSRATAPSVTIDAATTEKIKTSMGKRYNTVHHRLDLSHFSSDPDLMQEGLYVSLHKSDMMNAVVQIIKENIPQIQQLDLSKNKLTNLDGLTSLVGVCKDLKSLILKNNKLRTIAILNAIKGIDLLELVLDGNALCDNFKDQSTYISIIREKFPKVIKLDGQELPAPILFSLGTAEVLPPSKGSSFPGEEVKTLVAQFLEQYYTIFDSNNRQPLLEAYHDQAVFSFSASKMYDKGWSLQEYILDSRNLLKQDDNNLRHKLLRQGRLSVVSALSQMPQTQHDPTSFTVDVAHVSHRLMCFTVTGVFKEVANDTQNPPLRTFSRTFMVVPQGQGFSIINDIMYLTNATSGQIKAFRMVTPTPTPSPAPSNEKTADEQQQMVVEFSNWTGMNFEFSAKCLEENDWDYQKAANVFQTLNARGSIPIEAFQKSSS